MHVQILNVTCRHHPRFRNLPRNRLLTNHRWSCGHGIEVSVCALLAEGRAPESTMSGFLFALNDDPAKKVGWILLSLLGTCKACRPSQAFVKGPCFDPQAYEPSAPVTKGRSGTEVRRPICTICGFVDGNVPRWPTRKRLCTTCKLV